MCKSKTSWLALLVSNVHARSAENNVEIHTVNTNGRIILDTQINVFLDTEPEVTVLGKVVTAQLVFFDLKEKCKNWLKIYKITVIG